MELEKSVLSEALSRIQKLENDLALSRIQIDQSEKEKQDLTAIVKKLKDSRLDYLIGQLDSNVSVLNAITENMKHAECNEKNDLISLRSDDEEIIDVQKSLVNEHSHEDEKLTSVTESLNRVHEYIQKVCVQKICNDEDTIVIDDVKYNDVISISDYDSDGSDVQCVSHPPKFRTTAVIELDESSTQSNNEDCVLLSDDLSIPPSSNKNSQSITRSSFIGVFQKQAHKKKNYETPASSNTKKQQKNFHDNSRKPVSFLADNASIVIMKEEKTLRNSSLNNAPRLRVKQERDLCSEAVVPKSFSIELYKLPIEINEEDNINQNVGAKVVVCSKSNSEEHSSADISQERIDSISDQSPEDVRQETTSANVEATLSHADSNQDPDANIVVCSKPDPKIRSSANNFQERVDVISNQWIEDVLPETASPNVDATPSHVDNSKKDPSHSTSETKTLCNVLQKKTLVSYDESDSSDESTPTTNSKSSAKNSKISRQSTSSFDETSANHSESDDSSSDIFDSEIEDLTSTSRVQHNTQSKTSSSITSYRKKSWQDDEQSTDISESESVSDNSTTSSNKQIISVREHFLNTTRRKQSFSNLNYVSDSSSTLTDPQIISVRMRNDTSSKRLKIDQQRGENFSVVLKREIIDVDDEILDAPPQEKSTKKQKKSDHSYHYDAHSHLPDSKSSCLFQEMRIRNRLPIIPCQFCDECFGDAWRYSKHLNSKHVGDKRVFTCSICNFVTTTVALHRRHITKLHGDLFLLGSGPQNMQNLKKDHAYALYK